MGPKESSSVRVLSAKASVAYLLFPEGIKLDDRARGGLWGRTIVPGGVTACRRFVGLGIA